MLLPGVLPVLLQARIDISVSQGMVDFKVSQWNVLVARKNNLHHCSVQLLSLGPVR